ncbi:MULTISPECIES: hypothetical protein [Actinoalloteichus]|uniref:Uncharacterized protein n=1 Tax=Actinoalloteichus fjordicus TaxID=1612552 RepID=A0AAC9PUW6_9PSEU|nr:MULTISPECIES: hypothetical protein [Actinoalloteichus]APU17510.1 hypothetical protein UA74_27535 [Actinoalloteichus fjordicus]APU23587.1 hypothetical protein UA75_28080 [Actinoalloteichus sp. GBA129-24]
MTALVDVYITVPAGGGTEAETLLLVEGVSIDTAELIADRSVWPVLTKKSECARCTEEPLTETEHYVTPVAISSTKATEYFAWMQLPPAGGKVPWSMVAHHIAPGEVTAFSSHLRRRVSVQPMP